MEIVKEWLTAPNLQTLLISTSASVLSIVAVLRLFLSKYLESKFRHYFDRKIEVVKADYALNLESLKSEIQYINDRASRSNEREYQAIADAWEAFLDAHETTGVLVYSFSRDADLTSMNETELSEYVDGMQMHASWKRAIQDATPRERNKVFGRYRASKWTNEAGQKLQIAKSLSQKYSVFMPAELYALFSETIAFLRSCWIEREFASGGTMRDESNCMAFVSGRGEANLEKVKTAVRNRLLRKAA